MKAMIIIELSKPCLKVRVTISEDEDQRCWVSDRDANEKIWEGWIGKKEENRAH